MDNGIGPVVVNGEARDVTTTAKNWEVLSPEQKQALAEQKRSEAAQLDAMIGSAPIQAQPTPEELDANLASQEQSARVVQKDPDAAVVSPPEPTAAWGELPTAPIPETPRFTSQQMNQSVDATRPMTAVAQRDEISADEAAQKQRLFQQELAQREAVAKQVADIQARLQADIDKASAEYAKTASLSREQVTSLMQFAAGLGALGAGLARTPNFANDNINKAMDRALEEKKALMHAGIQKLEGLRARPAQIEKFREQALADIMAKQKAEVGLMGAASAKMMARFPQASDALRAKQAELQAGFDKEYAQYVGENTKRAFSETLSSAKGGTPRSMETEDQRKLAVYSDSMLGAIKELKSLNPISDEALKKAQDNEMEMFGAAEDAKSVGGALKVNLYRKAGILTRSKYEGLDDNDKVYLNAMNTANESFQRLVSGANVMEKELVRLQSQLELQPNDGAKLREWKLHKMEVVARNFQILSGTAGERLTAAQLMDESLAKSAEKTKGAEVSRVRGIPAAKQDAAISAVDDYTAIRDAMKAKKLNLTNRESLDLAEAYTAQKKAAQNGSVDEDAARFFREVRQRKGI